MIRIFSERRRHAVLAILLATSASPAVFAQSLDYGALEEIFDEPVTTSVTGSPQRASDMPATTEIVTAEQIRRSGATDIPGVLKHTSGLDVVRSTADHADVGLRGYNQAFSPRLLVLVDGRQVYADYYGFTPWSTIPIELASIRQIEVVRGPNSALFGFNAVGGVINIVTYDALNEGPDSAQVTAGTQDAVRGSLASRWALGENGGLRVSAGYDSGDGFAAPPSLESRGDERTAFSLSGGWRFTDSVEAGVEVTHSDVEHVERSSVYTINNSRYDTESVKAHVSADTTAGLVDASIYTNSILGEIDATPVTPPLRFENRVRVARAQLVSKVARAHTLRVSAEHRDNSLPTTSFEGAEVFYDVSSIGGMWEWRGSSRLVLTNAVRFDRLSMGRSGPVPPGFGLSNEDWNRSRTETSFNTSLLWRLNDRDALRFLIGRGVQLPNLMNLGGFLVEAAPGLYLAGVPSLPTTEVDNYELGWDRALPGLEAKLRVGLYSGSTRRLVADVGGGDFARGLLGTPTVLGDSHVDGFELALESAGGGSWRWGGRYAFTRIDDRFAPDATVADTLIDYEHTTPRHVITARGGWSGGPWDVDAYLRYKSRRDVIDNVGVGVIAGTLEPLSSVASLDARLAYAHNDRLTLSLAGENLNRSEQRVSSAPPVERRVVAGIAFKLR